MRMRGSECIGKNAYECMAAEKEIRRGKKKKIKKEKVPCRAIGSVLQWIRAF